MPSRLSVITAVYNGERFVSEAVDSVLKQTFADFEFIIVDDGSTDGTSQILKQHALADHRVRVVTQPNRGISAALNRAIDEASSEIVAHIDADDRALPEWLESQLDFLAQHPECSVVSSYAYFIDTRGKRFGRSENPIDVEKGVRTLQPKEFLDVIHSTVLMKKSDVIAVGGYRNISAEDRDLWGRIVTAGLMIRCNAIPLVEYRLHGTSETTRKLDTAATFERRGIDMNIVKRLQGQPELSPQEVQAWYKARSAGEKFHEFRRLVAGDNYKKASRHFSEKQWLPFAWTLGLAVAMRPLEISSRVLRKVRA